MQVECTSYVHTYIDTVGIRQISCTIKVLDTNQLKHLALN
jgi:hypothetical protein